MQDVRIAGAWRDAVLYLLSAGVCAIVVLASSHAIHTRAARWALPVYVLAAFAAAVVAGRQGRLSKPFVFRLRVVLAVAVMVVAGVVLQGVLISERAADPGGHHAHSETALVEQGAQSLAAGVNPYDTEFDDESISFWSPRIRSHLPFLPLMLVFGVPSALVRSPLTDGRVVFALAAVAVLLLAFARWPADGERKLLVFQWLLVLPTGTLIMVGGGHDLPVLAVLFLALVLLDRGALGWSALALGVALAMRQNAAVCLPFLALAAGPDLRTRLRYATGSVATALVAVVPFGIWNATALVEDTVLWPVNLGDQANNAETPTVGSLVVSVTGLPSGITTALLLLGAVVAMAVVAWRRPPRTASQAALLAGLALLALVVLAPSGRFGYLLYPVNLLVWWRVLRPSGDFPSADEHATRTDQKLSSS